MIEMGSLVVLLIHVEDWIEAMVLTPDQLVGIDDNVARAQAASPRELADAAAAAAVAEAEAVAYEAY